MWRRVLAASIALMVLCIVGFVGTLVWHGFGGDHDKYGRVDIPGSGMVTLPAGEVEVHYAVRLATSGGDGGLTTPSLRFNMEAPGGAHDPVVTEDRGGSVIVNSAAHVRIWKLQVQDAGDYSVTTDGDVDGYIAPQLTFGQRSPVPAWPAAVFALVFVVALALVVVAAAAAKGGSSRPHAAPATIPYGPASSAKLNTNTPEQELARLEKLRQLTDLHRAGTLSDAEYDAAKARIG